MSKPTWKLLVKYLVNDFFVKEDKIMELNIWDNDYLEDWRFISK